MEERKYEWNLNNKSTLFIIGNGFDCDLGLKTNYQNFLVSGQFKSLLKEDRKNYFALHLQRENKINSWVNVENEIIKYAIHSDDSFGRHQDETGAISYNNEYKENFKLEYYEVKNALKEYLRTQDIIENKDENDYKYSNAFKIISKIGNVENAFFLDFNYTLTIEKILSKIYGGDRKDYYNVIHIHGSLKEEDDIVFGVQDDIDIRKIKDKLCLENICMYKSSSPFLKADKINDLLDKCHHIIFFGYSLGITDSSYFKDFFKDITEKDKIKKKQIDFFYKDDDALDEINNRIRDLANNKVLNLRKNHNVRLIPTNDVDKIYEKQIVPNPPNFTKRSFWD